MIYLAMLAAREAIAVSRFSPLAGIRYAETYTIPPNYPDSTHVSVPLRGLDMRKRSMVKALGLSAIKFQSPCGD